MSAAVEQETLDITQAEWRKINEFCKRGQQIIKQSSFGYHRRRLTLSEGTLSIEGSKSIGLSNIHQLTIGNPPKKLFRKTDGNPALWLTVDSSDRRSVSMLFNNIQARNFWVRAIIIYVGNLQTPSFIESNATLQSALSAESELKDGALTLCFSSNGTLRPRIEPVHQSIAHQTTGELHCHIICASNLPKADKLSKSDPFVLMTNHLGESVRTKTIMDCHNPIWNEPLRLHVHDQQPVSIQIFDEDDHSANDLLCSCLLNVAADCTATKEVKFHETMDPEPRFQSKLLSTLTFTALYQPAARCNIDFPEIGHEASNSLNVTPKDSPVLREQTAEEIAGRDGPRDIEESLRSKISSHSTSDLHVDYLDLHSMHRKQHDVFRGMASSLRMSDRGLFDDDPTSTSRINTFSTSTERQNGAPTPLEIEERINVPDAVEIEMNPHKFYVLIGRGEERNSVNVENACYLEMDRIVDCDEDQRAIQRIDAAMLSVRDCFISSKHRAFESLVLPHGDLLERALTECGAVVFSHFGRAFEALIQSLEYRSDSEHDDGVETVNPTPRSVSIPRLNAAVNVESTSKQRTRPKPPPIVTDFGVKTEEATISGDESENGLRPEHEAKSVRSKSSMSERMSTAPIPEKVLLSLGVEPLTKWTVSLMRTGERFNIYDSSGAPPTTNKVHLRSDGSGLRIRKGVHIEFADIVALHAVDHDEGWRCCADPMASFMIEHGSSYVILEVVHREKCLHRRNWWINGIISCLAHYEPHRVPPSVSAVSKLLRTVTVSGDKPCSLRLVDPDEIEDTLSMTASMEMVSIDTETARKRAVQRVRRYKALQEEVENMAIRSRKKMETEMERISRSIDADTIPFGNAQSDHDPHSQSQRARELDDQSDDGVTYPHRDSPHESDSIDAELSNEEVVEPLVDTKTTTEAIKEEADGATKARAGHLIQFCRPKDAVTMRSTISNLTRKLQAMESLQEAQSKKVRQFVDRESTVIARYQREIKRMRREKKQMESEKERVDQQRVKEQELRIKVERSLAIKQWDRAKHSEQKQKAERSEVDALRLEMEALNERLLRANSGYKSAMQSYHREQEHRIKAERRCERLEQRYVVDAQRTKDEVLEMAQRNATLKRQCKALQSSVTQSAANERKIQQLLQSEVTRTQGLQNQLAALRARLQRSTARNLKLEKDRDRKVMTVQRRADEVQQQNGELLRRHDVLRHQVNDLKLTIDAKDEELKQRDVEIERLKEEVKNIPLNFQQKLIDFTQYAQEQMTLQQQTLLAQNSAS